jgi:hypothetical protein
VVLPSAGKVGADAASERAVVVLPSAGTVGADAASERTAAVLPSAGKVCADATAYRAAAVLVQIEHSNTVSPLRGSVSSQVQPVEPDEPLRLE